jgi:hypothetical protein
MSDGQNNDNCHSSNESSEADIAALLNSMPVPRQPVPRADDDHVLEHRLAQLRGEAHINTKSLPSDDELKNRISKTTGFQCKSLSLSLSLSLS